MQQDSFLVTNHTNAPLLLRKSLGIEDHVVRSGFVGSEVTGESKVGSADLSMEGAVSIQGGCL